MKCGKLSVNLFLIFVVLVFTMAIYGCSQEKIRVYDVSTQKIITMSLEDYVAGATAAEIDDSYASEVICAQAVLCRTMALWQKNNQKCSVAGADISTSPTDGQAFASSVPQKIKNLVKQTKGQVLKYNNNIIYPYFCSNCGGKSSLPINVFGSECDYLYEVDTLETAESTKNYFWTASVSKSEILWTMQKLGKNLASIDSFEISKTDDSGRATEFSIGKIAINANTFRLALGSSILKSCKITSIYFSDQNIEFEGLGYGHGVGLSQEGANVLASQNYTYKEILLYWYKNCQIVQN
jgi:stage II sporulation protein D